MYEKRIGKTITRYETYEKRINKEKGIKMYEKRIGKEIKG